MEETIVPKQLDPLSIQYTYRNGILFPIFVPSGENPVISEERILNAWKMAGGLSCSTIQFIKAWELSCQTIVETHYGTEHSKEWKAIKIASSTM